MAPKKRTSMLVKKSKSFHALERQAIAKFGECENPPQHDNPKHYQYVRKLNYGLLDSQIASLSDDHRYGLTVCQPSKKQLEVKQGSLQLYPPGCDLQITQSSQDFDNMMKDIMLQDEIGIDLEFHQRFSFRGITSLIQISSEKADYIICPFSSREDIIFGLTQVLLDPSITKVFHAIDNDFLALRRDFNITVFGVVDTKEAYKLLESAKNAIGFENLMKYLDLQYEIDQMPEKEIAQKADFRLRPLPPPLIAYARHDSHAVLRAWNHLKIRLADKGIPVEKVFNETSALVRDLTYKPPKQEDPMKGLQSVSLPKNIDHRLATLKFVDLHRWRHQVAMMVDCSPRMVLTNQHLVEIISSSPTDSKEMQKLLDDRFPSFLRGHQGIAFFKVFQEGMRTPEYNPKCHNCFLNSHQAWACWKAKDRTAWKRYMNDPANQASKQRQYERRQRKLQENREKRRQQRQ